MADALQKLLTGAVPLAATRFGPGSRYALTETTTCVAPDGTMVPYLRRRFVPPPERFVTLTEHTVTRDERLDTITATYLGDPEQFWRICDANGAVDPNELTGRVGRRLRITLPEGLTVSTRG